MKTKTCLMKPLILFVISLIGIKSVTAQNIDSLLLTYTGKLPMEKIHIHMDKEMYVAGETIWYKGYVFTGNDPSTISTSLFLEVIDAAGRIIVRNSLPIIESSAN